MLDRMQLVTLRMSVDDLLTMAYAVVCFEGDKTVSKEQSRRIVDQIEKAIVNAHALH